MHSPTFSSTVTFAARDLAVWRGMHCLCEQLNFTAQAGSLLHIQGANGAGKTSLLRVLAGLAPAESGAVQWCGRPIASGRDAYQADTAYLAHANGIKGGLSPLENLHFAARLWHDHPQVAPEIVLEEVALSEQAHTPCQFLSAGQQRRVALARILMAPGRLWLLDEPFTSLDTAAIQRFRAAMHDHLTVGGIIIMTSHQPMILPGHETHVITLGEGRA